LIGALRFSQNGKADHKGCGVPSEVKPRALPRPATALIVALLLATLTVFITRAAQRKRTLIVNGYSQELAVVEINGRSYVDIEELAHLTNGSLTIHGDRMILTMPPPAKSVSTAPPTATQPVLSGFSKEFLQAGIEELSDIREWRTALTDAVRRGYPITEEWLSSYSGQARKSLATTTLAISTDSDRKAFQLLTNVFDNMQRLSDRFIQAKKSMTYIEPGALDNDPLDQRILKCARALASMAANNEFADDASCH
jgi:hypothetical protein